MMLAARRLKTSAVWHAVPEGQDKALCGARPLRALGWAPPRDLLGMVSCMNCLKKLKKLGMKA